MGMGTPNGAFNTPYGMTNGLPEPYYNNDSWLYRSRVPYARPMQQTAQPSPISNLLAQALAAKPNAPGLSQLFPGMVAPNMGGSQGMPIGLLGQGQYGAGRFLGSNVMGNPSLTSTAMNT